MSHRPCDSTKDTGAVCTLGWDASATKQGQPKGDQPNRCRIPEELQITLGFKCAPLAAFFVFAVLGSLHGAFICAYWKLAT